MKASKGEPMSMQGKSIVALCALLFTFGVSGIPVAHAAVIGVDTLADAASDGDGCSLREAITNANNNDQTFADCAAGSGADTISFTVSGTIALASILPHISDAAALTIDGTAQSI